MSTKHVRVHRLARLPSWFTRWLGYRSSPPKIQPDYIVWIWSFIGAFCGISLIQAVFGQVHYFLERQVPSVVASYGASAVLIYGAIDAPLAQPRAVFGGHFIGALTGVCITKLFHLLPTEERFLELQWLAGSLACATSIVLMQITSTTHPPAGATALLAAVNADVRDMSWYYLPPVFWFRPAISIPALPSPDLGGPEVEEEDAVDDKAEAKAPLPA